MGIHLHNTFKTNFVMSKMSFDDLVPSSGQSLLKDIEIFYNQGKYLEAGEIVRYITHGRFREHYPDLPDDELTEIETKAKIWSSEIPLYPGEVRFE